MKYMIPFFISLIHNDYSIDPELLMNIEKVTFSNCQDTYYISKSILKRIYKYMGYNSYRLFKQNVLNQYTIKYNQIYNEYVNLDYSFLYEQFASHEKLLKQPFTTKQIQDIKDAKRIIFVGSNELCNIAYRFASNMWVLKRVVYMIGNLPFDYKEGDYLIYVSKQGRTLSFDDELYMHIQKYPHLIISNDESSDLPLLSNNASLQFEILGYYLDILLMNIMEINND